jgi:shikimate kinase
LDIDLVIEARLGCTIQEFFAKNGETQFRREETETLQDLLASNLAETVVATGGGIMTTEGNFALMQKLGHVIGLKATVASLAQRLHGDSSRPLLAQDDATAGEPKARLISRLQQLLIKRERVYQLPPLLIETDSRSPNEVAAEIVRHLRLAED